MTDTPDIVYTHESGESLEFFVGNTNGAILMPGKSVERMPNKIGKAVDPNQPFRLIEGVAKLTRAELVQMKDYMMPATAPTYGDTYPNITLKIDGSTTWTILCMVSKFTFRRQVDDKWMCSVQFEERSA